MATVTVRPLVLMTNPYESPHDVSSYDECKKRMHPDWKWMALFVYAGSAICMFGIFGKTNPPNSSIVGFGHGVIPGPAILGDVGFSIAIPLLAIIPTCLIAIPMRMLYRNRRAGSRTTPLNFAFLAIGFVLAILNASLYRGD